MKNATFKTIKFGRFELNASSVEHSTEVRQLFLTPHFPCVMEY